MMKTVVQPVSSRASMGNGNRLKVGYFGQNCSSGRYVTLAKERWSASWDDNLRASQLADDAGMDFLLPIGRWKGYGGATDYAGTSFETITWATGLLAATKRINVFGTVHVPLFHPLIAAKQMVTADQVGHGRFGLNIVAGWNEDEFNMFGISQKDHSGRYEQAQEWIDALKRTWREDDFDFAGRFYDLHLLREKKVPLPDSVSVEVIPGISALNACAARLGAPLMHDFAVVSLSDRLTPWETIARRLDAAAGADFVIVLYNPKSASRRRHIRKAQEILLRRRPGSTPVGIVKGATRQDEAVILSDLDSMPFDEIDMQTTVIIGNSQSVVWNGRMITPRGYENKEAW